MILIVEHTVKILKGSDIEVCCNQTEIAFHSRNSKQTLQDHYDNVAQISMFDEFSDIDYSRVVLLRFHKSRNGFLGEFFFNSSIPSIPESGLRNRRIEESFLERFYIKKSGNSSFNHYYIKNNK